MKLTNKLAPVALAVSLAAGSFALPGAASAEVEYNAAVSSMYLWRGLDSSNGPTINGGVDYTTAPGLYVGAWASSGLNGTGSSTNGADGYELDLYAGFAGEVGGFGYDISYWDIDYPQVTGPNGDSSNELALSLSYAGLSLGYVMNTDSASDYEYTTLGYSIDKFGITYGMSDDGAGAEYSHVDLSYSPTDALTFTVSKASDDTAGVPEEALIVVSYSLPIK